MTHDGSGELPSGTGAYLLGSRDSLSGVVPPPGTYFSIDAIYIKGSVDRLSIGGIVLANADSEALVTKLNFTQGFKGKILGGRPAMTLTVPFVVATLKFDSVIFGAARRISDNNRGFGDITITPGLGWDKGKSHFAFQTSFFLPTGYYKKASVNIPSRSIQALSFGKNRVAIDPTLSYTYLNPKSGLEFSGAVGTTFSFRNKATDYQTAPEFHSEIAALKHWKNGLALGAAGYAYQQWGNDSGPGLITCRLSWAPSR